MSGVKHVKNSKNKWGSINEICKPYIKDIEKRFKKNKSYRFTRSEGSDAQLENNHRSHLWRVFWYIYLQYKSGRKRKQAIRKIYKYWHGCPDAWGEYNNKFMEYDLMTPWPMYCTNEKRSPAGNPIVYPKIKDVIFRNQMALTYKQNMEFLIMLAEHSQNYINSVFLVNNH